MGDILKEALAEAKLVKKVAIEAAKEQLNEALSPKIESMLSKKIREELDTDDNMDDIDNDDELDETEDPGSVTDKESKNNQDVTPALSETEDPGSVTDKESKDDQDVTSALSEQDEMDDEEDLEVESILRELEDEDETTPESEDDEELDVNLEQEQPDDDDEELDVNLEQDENEDEPLPGLEDEPNEEDDEDINIEEILDSVNEEEYPGDDNDENEDSEQQNVVKTLESKIARQNKRLSEYKKAVNFLRNELSEVNLLNNKLFLTTKLLKKFNVSNKTKMNIIETFDRAKNVREVKLIYTTLYESLKSGGVNNNAKINSLKEIKQKTNSSSKTVIVENFNPKSAILTEGDELRARFSQLANIKKNK